MKLAIAHVHHGEAGSQAQTEYRQRTQEFVRDWAQARDIPFFTNENGPKKILTSEQEMREFREACIGEWKGKHVFDAVAFAHHQDDLLETRLIRLIRGSGTQGLRSMCLYRRDKFRPLLSLSSREIRAYAEARGVKWVEDPSNARADILRNWLRQKWLPSLEMKRPGALKALARSLETISPRPKDFDLAPFVGLRRDFFVGAVNANQRELLAQYLKALGLKGYGQTHVDEILKRLSSRQKNLEFEMLGLQFKVSPDFLWASRV